MRFGMWMVALAPLASGCLSQMHEIPRAELIALSQKPPETRGQRVRVVQGLPGEEEPPAPAPAHSHTAVFIGGSVSTPIGPVYRSNKLAAAKADEAKAWFIAAGVVAAALALSEGSRYDGWLELDPGHPVHLFGPMGQYTWVPLGELDPELANWAHKAMIRSSEGPITHLGRAPLDRVGFTYSLLLGAAEIPSYAEEEGMRSRDTGDPGFMGHIQVGMFPHQMFGILLDFGMGFRDNRFGDEVFESRNALELQFLPLEANRFYAGAYGNIGLGLRLEDGARGRDRQSFLAGGGGLMQFEMTTRMTLTARVGLTYLFGEPTAEAALGVSIF
jgi:hypothetical protein